jgi:cardiolipin synthase (CMP-forming)
MIDRNFPNYLTIARILVIPIIILSFYLDNSIIARKLGAILFVLASVTDFFDGYFARKYNYITTFGRMFDPIADKLLVGCVIIMLVKKNMANEVPCILILAREFFVAGLREFLAEIHISVPVTHLAKVKTFIQMSALTLLILGSKGSGIEWLDIFAHTLLWIAAILTLITGHSYFKACSKYF